MKSTQRWAGVLIVATILAGTITTQAEDVKKVGDDYRAVIWGMNGDTPWTFLLPAEGLEGLNVDKHWRREGNTIIGAKKEGSAVLTFGEEGWKDYEIDFYVMITEGSNLDVGFRASATQSYVFKFLLGWQACAVTMRDSSGTPPLDHLSVVNHKIERNREYHVQIAIRGSSITTYVDGNLVNQVTDKVLKAGKCYLEVWQGNTEFRNIRYRRIG